MKFFLASLKTLTDSENCSEKSRIKFLFWLSFALIGKFFPMYIHSRLSEQFSGSQAVTVPALMVQPRRSCLKQSFGSGSGSTGSTCFWASWIRIHQSEVWIRILLSPSNKSKKNLDSYCFVTYFLLFIFENDVQVPPDPLVKRHGSADPDPDPDPPQNVMDPQHWLEGEDRVQVERQPLLPLAKEGGDRGAGCSPAQLLEAGEFSPAGQQRRHWLLFLLLPSQIMAGLSF
jgi:hypothetical protein